MRALVTGITGFIGSHVAELLLAEGDQVLGLGRSGSYRAGTPAQLIQHVPLFGWDVAQSIPTDLRARIDDFSPTVVFHFAGLSIPAQCGRKTPTPEAVAVNVEGTQHVLDLIDQLSVRPKLIFASTMHVYAHVSPEQPFVREDSPLDPISAYGETKRASEQSIEAAMSCDAFPACIVRGFHHIGPRQPAGLMLTDWLVQLIQPACSNLKVRSTNSYLDLIDVRDAARAYRLLAATEQARGIYNLGSGTVSKSGDVLGALLEVMNKQVEIEVGSQEERWNAIADIAKLKELGWQPSFSYRDTLQAMLTSHENSSDPTDS